MESYSTDDEQMKALKKWWKEEGLSTVLIILAAVAGYFAWQGWKEQKTQSLYQASIDYQVFLETVAELEAAPNDEIKIAQMISQANDIKENHKNTGYAAFAAMFKAKQAVAEKDFELAEQELNWVLNSKKHSTIKNLATLRLAKIKMQIEKYDEALSLVMVNVDEGYFPLFKETEGDILLAKEEYLAAYEAYQAAEDAIKTSDQQVSSILMMKLSYAKGFM